jgi:hypothetical protein
MTENQTYAGVINVGQNRYVGSFGSLQPGDAIILERPRAVVVVHHNAPELELFTLTDEQVGTVTVNEAFAYALVFGEEYQPKQAAETIKVDEIVNEADTKAPDEDTETQGTTEVQTSGTEVETTQAVVTDPAPVANPVTPAPVDETVVTPVVVEDTTVVTPAPGDETVVTPVVVEDATVVADPVTPAPANDAVVEDAAVVQPTTVTDESAKATEATEEGKAPQRRRTNTNQ